ncbi:3-beta-hydroxysteroid sulfotransferase-like [Tachyglossus aculeatus]|uniref:3-beta-hydroxysteroid sulfotransferase-like n=1 Tax=Tachyglossus aculeatus TaxID=9261 RepID=UPI0018F5F0E2|nr:3-beta-hydroxysteroid sulfotransferase-like [Tachyglossus aculeatus]
MANKEVQKKNPFMTVKEESVSPEEFHYREILFPRFTSKKSLQFVEKEFQVQDGFTFLVSYPKSGTHWLIEILSLIQTNGDPTWVQTVSSFHRAPWIEASVATDMLKEIKPPHFLTTHLPIQFLPPSFFTSETKIIYLIRNPKDVAVSYYYFSFVIQKSYLPESFDQLLEEFLQGKGEKVIYGSWFEHIRGWLQMKDKENFLLVSYEELYQDMRGSVMKISRFLGKKLDEQALDSVVKYSSFQAMKDNEMSNLSLAPDILVDHSKGSLLRKGAMRQEEEECKFHHFATRTTISMENRELKMEKKKSVTTAQVKKVTSGVSLQ